FKAVLDVYEQEPLPMESPLRGLENVLLIPHMGGPTTDRYPYIAKALADDIPRVLAGKESSLAITVDMMRRMTR
ncbi:MAG: hydroxyacid dehydrogenase, partial [Clostridia bacterium]|nr:hydroxyacid dehydrogenase [Clostridia bacterium]